MSGHNTGMQGPWTDANIWCGPVIDDVVAGLDGRLLARAILDLLGLERGFLCLFRLEYRLGQAD